MTEQLVRYLVPAVVVVVLCALAGYGLIGWWIHGLTLTDQLGVSVAAGLGSIVIATTWWGYTGRSAATPARVVVAVALVGAASWCWHARRVSQWGPRRCRRVLGGVVVVLCAAVVATVVYWPLFASGLLPSSLTTFVYGTNDQAIYVLQADNVSRVGFDDLGRVAGFDIGEWTKGDHTGTSTAYATFDQILGIESWRMAIPMMTAVIAMTLLLLVAVARRVSRARAMVVGAAAVWATVTPFAGVVQSEYFLGQAVARCLLVAQVLAVLMLFQSPARRTQLTAGFVLALTMSAGLLAYPSGQVTNLAVVMSFAAVAATASLIRTGARGHVRGVAQRAGVLAVAVVVGVLSVLPRWTMIIDTIRLYSRPGITGFPQPTLTFKALLGIGDVPGHGWSSVWWLVAVVVYGLAAIGLVHTFRWGWSRWLTLVSLVGVPCAGYVVIAVKIGTATYQTWKFLATIQSLATLGIALLCASGAELVASKVTGVLGQWWRSHLVPVAVFVPVGVVALFMLGVAQAPWREASSSGAAFAAVTARPALVAVRGNRLVHEQPGLTVTLRPYFETMVAPVVADLGGVWYGSDTYRGPGTTPPGCVLTTSDRATTDAVTSRHVAGDIVLAPWPSCRAPR